jgi:microcystin-dependent protein
LGKTVDGDYYEEIGGDQEILGPLHQDTIGESGSNYPHNNMMPSLCMNFIIALVGVYPPRN